MSPKAMRIIKEIKIKKWEGEENVISAINYKRDK
jgi:hypothetical protein